MDKNVSKQNVYSSDYIMPTLSVFILVGLYAVSRANYLLFHSLAEIFSIVIAFSIFIIIWNARRFMDNSYFLIIGVAYFYIGGIDVIHTLAYKGMGVFKGDSANLSTQLWIAARYLEALSFLFATFFLKWRQRTIFVFTFYAAVSGLLLFTIFFWQIFPVCFQEGAGLTAFKKTSEYVISLILVFAVGLLFQKRAAFDTRVLRLLIASIIVTIAAELSFTFYVSVYGVFNLIGHFFKIISFYLIYRAIIHIGIQKPFALLFRDLKTHEEALEKARDELEKRVIERTAELGKVIEQLKQEISERMQAEEELRKSEERFRTIADLTYSWEYWQDEDGDFIYISPFCEQITGYKAQEFINDPDLLMKIVDPVSQQDYKKHLEDIRKTKGVLHLDYRIVRHDGQERWVSHYCRPVYSANGTSLGRRSSNRDVTERILAENKILKYQEQLRVITWELSLAEERERRRIAIDLHDKVGQTLAMSQFNLKRLHQAVGSNDINASLENIIQLLDVAISDMRSLTFDLSPPALYELGLDAALDELADQLQQEYGLPITVKDDGQSKPMSENARVILYRATRELMLNVVKHAQARQMIVSINKKNGKISVEVSDDGVGFNTTQIFKRLARTKSLGLLSIRERLNPLNGEMDIISTPGKGTVVTMKLPFEQIELDTET
ncbi:MAG: PAS domain S-box protein [Deltaproteobacteria bacterium]|nr:PAS domain S-box protein [Deltaproteobacteria bacterium]